MLSSRSDQWLSTGGPKTRYLRNVPSELAEFADPIWQRTEAPGSPTSHATRSRTGSAARAERTPPGRRVCVRPQARRRHGGRGPSPRVPGAPEAHARARVRARPHVPLPLPGHEPQSSSPKAQPHGRRPSRSLARASRSNGRRVRANAFASAHGSRRSAPHFVEKTLRHSSRDFIRKRTSSSGESSSVALYLADDLVHDFAGAAADGVEASVAVEAFYDVLSHVAVAAVDLDRLVADR